MTVLACVDVGSTFTKAAVLDEAGRLVGLGSVPTTAGTDVLDGLDAAVAAAGGGDCPVLACSSAGGGLRLAVVGYERLVTARTGAQVGLTAGARVVHVVAGRLDRAGLAGLRNAAPDVLLLVGGTDGGDEETLLHNAVQLASTRPKVPVVLAGNAAARDTAAATLAAGRVPVTLADNVLPRLGEVNPGPARAAIREVFLRHVIGGKGLSRGRRFRSLVRCATPDAVLSGVRVLAGLAGTDLLVVDVGGATTDVYSVLTPDPERERGPARPAAGTVWHGRTVEGDLGVRSSAPALVEAALAERLLPVDRAVGLREAARERAVRPGLLPADPAAQEIDLELAGLAVTLALRRHGRDRDLRGVGLAIGSGGVLRHAPEGRAVALLESALSDHAGGWPLPRAPRVCVDADYVLAAAGLLATGHGTAAAGVLRVISP